MNQTHVIIMTFENGTIGLTHPPAGQDPEVAYRRACEDNKGNATIKMLALAQVLRIAHTAIGGTKCRILRICNGSGEWEIKCGACSEQTTILAQPGWILNKNSSLPKHCQHCGIRFAEWGT